MGDARFIQEVASIGKSTYSLDLFVTENELGKAKNPKAGGSSMAFSGTGRICTLKVITGNGSHPGFFQQGLMTRDLLDPFLTPDLIVLSNDIGCEGSHLQITVPAGPDLYGQSRIQRKQQERDTQQKRSRNPTHSVHPRRKTALPAKIDPEKISSLSRATRLEGQQTSSSVRPLISISFEIYKNCFEKASFLAPTANDLCSEIHSRNFRGDRKITGPMNYMSHTSRCDQATGIAVAGSSTLR